MKVLHLVWNLIRGGTEGQCARLAMELAGRGDNHQVMVFRREGFFVDAVEQACGSVNEIGIEGMLQGRTVVSIHRLVQWLKRERFDMLHAWDADAAIFGHVAAAWAGIPLITSRRDLGEIYPEYKKWLMKRADRQARLVVANAGAIVSAFVQQGAEENKFRIIPNILDTAEFDALASRPFPLADRLPVGDRVVMVARLDPEKDIPTFIYAAEMILKQHPGASFLLAGDGVERLTLESMVYQRKLEKKIVFLGDVTGVPSLLSSCSVGMLTPSRNEGLSNTIMEYMAAGLPVVATECGGNRELISPPLGGMITDVGDAQALAKSVVTLLRNPSMRKAMGQHNRKVIEENHQPGPVGEMFAALYREALHFS